MAHNVHTEVFNCSPDQFWSIVSDYEKYPEFLSEVKACHILKDEGNRKLVEYSINMIKNFTYSLWMTEEKPSKISWELAGGDLFKLSNGSWTLQEEAGQTRATYDVDAKFKVFVPGPVAKTLVSVHLPNMMAAYHTRVNQIYGQS